MRKLRPVSEFFFYQFLGEKIKKFVCDGRGSWFFFLSSFVIFSVLCKAFYPYCQYVGSLLRSIVAHLTLWSGAGYCSCATVGHPSHSGVRGNFSLRISFFSIGTHIPFLCEPPTHAYFNNMQIQCGICISFYDVACWHEEYWIGIRRIWQRKICGLY
jgi:hypothetical protein